jgi:hypothetical protein
VRFLLNLFRRKGDERDLDAEVRSYMDALVEEKIRAGMSMEEARRGLRPEESNKRRKKYAKHAPEPRRSAHARGSGCAARIGCANGLLCTGAKSGALGSG